MKKATLKTLIDYIVTNDVEELSEVKTELLAEYNKGAEQKAKNAATYESFHGIVMEALDKAKAPVTLAELWDYVSGEVPEDVTKGKVQYAVTRLWTDEIVRIDGNPSQYKRA